MVVVYGCDGCSTMINFHDVWVFFSTRKENWTILIHVYHRNIAQNSHLQVVDGGSREISVFKDVALPVPISSHRFIFKRCDDGRKI